MPRFTTLLALCVTALTAGAAANPIVIRDPPISLPLVRRFNATATGGQTIVQRDQARARLLAARAAQAKASTSNTNGSTSFRRQVDFDVSDGVVSYVASVGVGSPPTFYDLIVDTGSSVTWVGATPDKPYVKTGSSVDTNEEVAVTYGSGSFAGEEFVDTVTLGSLVIPNQGVGSAQVAVGFDGVDGILGIGPVDLTSGTISGGGTITTVTENAFSQGLIPERLIGISFEPTTSADQVNGELTFGAIDPSKFTGPLHFVPITSTSPADQFVGIDQTISYGSTELLSSAGITDTGTTLILLASDALQKYQQVTGATLDLVTGFLQITPEQFSNLQPLTFNIGGTAYELTPNAQLWPRALNTGIGGQADSIYLIVNDLGRPSGKGMDFVDGFAFLQRFYYVFDEGNSQVGFATTSFTDATTN
ncbi:family A1 protease [Dichomitus squalens]|nr:family A1 protease [Dichomitus squalens]